MSTLHAPPPLRVEDLEVRLAERTVLEEVSLEVGTGHFVGLVGPNGAGKTTLLRAVLGLIPVEKGSILVDGEAYTPGKGSIGYVPQRHEFAWDFPTSVAGAVMTGRTRAIGWMRRPGKADHTAVDTALERTGMTDLRHRPIGELSGGQRQRVLVARALALEPKVLLLDEPFTGVDVPTREMLASLVIGLLSDGLALLMTTHDLRAAVRACTHLCLLNRTIVAQGRPENLQDPEVWMEAFGVPSADLLLLGAEGIA